jgi:CAAX prenyl protease-like protein
MKERPDSRVLSVYLWLYRNDLRFPGALALLPLGAATIWLVNALRIVALIAIGTSGWPAVARGGFHSQAGWLAFNGVALSFVALTIRGRYFQRVVPLRSRSKARDEPDQTAAYLGPFVAITATAMLTGAVSAGFDWLYPLRILSTGVVLWLCRKHYRSLKITWSWPAVAIGLVTFVVWLALIPSGVHRNDGWPIALKSVPVQWAASWLFFRVVGYVLVTPLAEELAFRGFLTRRLLNADFQNVPWVVFVGLVSHPSVLFGAFHGGTWFATLAGMSLRSRVLPSLARRCGTGACDHQRPSCRLRVRTGHGPCGRDRRFRQGGRTCGYVDANRRGSQACDRPAFCWGRGAQAPERRN